ncbi:6-phosphogluconolactonase [Jatrophihabitans telluris]|uniref:6-phosphogluconolactonase n=1 Tax=Jatrophihabitans telluris TaxID=2038343 RepID=A0ABY4R381_9ACTN|nr:6-phosphogluconolactonase [Jatrophihabitans telluris]UQX90175.1 6-phosphogluconolactonase [Jatrophihabitans telluris]
MAAAPELVVQHDAEALATDVAARTIATLTHAQQGRGRAAIALTAGSIMESVWKALAASPSNDAVDWGRVDVFWGDERFVAADSPDRNVLAAQQLLLDHAPFSAARHRPMPASDGEYGNDLDAAAAGYSATLADARRPDDPDNQPAFDVVLLGVGPDGHCCSLFPEHPGLYDDSNTVIPVRNSPKPPPERLSLSFDGLNAAREIWVIASGEGKADAVALALGGAGRVQIPSAGAIGTKRTLWLVDRAAASKLPKHRYDPPVA